MVTTGAQGVAFKEASHIRKKKKKKTGKMQIQAAVEIWVLLSLPEVLPPYLSWSSCYVFFFSFFFSFKSWAVVRFASYSTPTSLLRYGGTSEMQGTSLCEDRSFLPFWSFRSEHSRLSRQGSLLFSNNFREACKITQENMGQWRRGGGGGGGRKESQKGKVFRGKLFLWFV